MTQLLIEVLVEGATPMLQHRATEEGLSGSTRTNSPGEENDPRDIAERAVYRLPGAKQLAVPGSAFARMLREAGGSHKAKGSRKSLKYIIPAAVLVLDDLCPLFLKDGARLEDYEVDSRPVTIPATKGRVMRHRARFNEWQCLINLRINDEILSEALVRQMFAEGLAQIGIGDFRPERGGPFGTGGIVQWKRLDVPLPKTAARMRNGAPAGEGVPA